MRNLILMSLLTFLLPSCAAGETTTGPAQEQDLWDALLSKPAIGLYGMAAGLAIGLAVARQRAAKLKKRAANKERTPGDTGDLLSLHTALGQHEQLIAELQFKLKASTHEQDMLKRSLAEAEQFSATPVRQRGPDIDQDDIPENKSQPAVTKASGLTDTTTLYYLKPSKEGSFKDSSKVKRPEEALYQLTYRNENPAQAALTFVDLPDNVYGAVQNEATWLLVVCERSNLPTPQTTSIRTDLPGIAVLKNGDWEVLQKAKITYV